MKKNLIALFLIATLCVEMTGCNIISTGKSETPVKTKKEIASTMDTNTFYVLHQDKKSKKKEKPMPLYSLPIGSEENEIGEQILWAGPKKYEKIPTLYKDDKLVFYSDTPRGIEDTFEFVRFQDLGVTFGISGLSKTESGRFVIPFDEDNTSFYPGSDAMKKICPMEGTSEDGTTVENVLLDSLGSKEKAEVRADNVSPYGVLLGLEKDAEYTANCYLGSVHKEVKLKANVHAFGSWEQLPKINYMFDDKDNDLMVLTIPNKIQTGYYAIMLNDEYYLFRYINGSKFDENTNFNKPNKLSEQGQFIDDEEEKEKEIAENSEYFQQDPDSLKSEEVYKMDVAGSGKKVANITFKDIKMTGIEGDIIVEEKDNPSPTTYRLYNDGEKLTSEFEAIKDATYTLRIKGAKNKKPTISVKNIK